MQLLKGCFKCSQIKAPSLSIRRYLKQEAGWEQDCKQVAEALHKYGLLYVEDERIKSEHNG
jgi:hypothetical protein